MDATLVRALTDIVGADHVRTDDKSLERYGQDALGIVHPPDVVAVPGTVQEIAAIARLCNARQVPLVVRGAGTGYTGGAVPTRGGVVLSVERLNRILEIDETNLLAVVEPAVVTADLQRAVEAVGLFYPPDPASLEVRPSVATSLNVRAGRAASNTARRVATSWHSRRCWRTAKSSRPDRKQ